MDINVSVYEWNDDLPPNPAGVSENIGPISISSSALIPKMDDTMHNEERNNAAAENLIVGLLFFEFWKIYYCLIDRSLRFFGLELPIYETKEVVFSENRIAFYPCLMERTRVRS
jgi:hypothetical protein